MYCVYLLGRNVLLKLTFSLGNLSFVRLKRCNNFFFLKESNFEGCIEVVYYYDVKEIVFQIVVHVFFIVRALHIIG